MKLRKSTANTFCKSFVPMRILNEHVISGGFDCGQHSPRTTHFSQANEVRNVILYRNTRVIFPELKGAGGDGRGRGNPCGLSLTLTWTLKTSASPTAVLDRTDVKTDCASFNSHPHPLVAEHANPPPSPPPILESCPSRAE